MSRQMSLAGLGLLILAGCQPTPGYTKCADVDCSGHGYCTIVQTSKGDVPTCVCDAGYSPTASGFLCPPATDTSLCFGVSCGEHGACASVHGAARCLCDAPLVTGPDGRSCVDTCASVTCGGHGTCSAEAGTPRCTCETGYRLSDDGLSCMAALPGESFLIYTLGSQGYASGKTVLSLTEQKTGKLVETTTYRVPLDPGSWRGINRQMRQQLTLNPSDLQLTALTFDDTLRLANVTRRRIAEVSFTGTQGTTTLQRGGKSTTIALAAAGQKTPIPMPGGLEFPGISFGCFSPVFYTMALARFDKTQGGTQSLEVLWPEAGRIGTVRVEAGPTSTPTQPVLWFPDWQIAVTYDGDFPKTIKAEQLGATWSRATTGAPADLNLDPPPETKPFVPAALPTDVTESALSFSSADGTALSGTLARPATAPAAAPAVLFVADAISASRDAPFLQLPSLALYRHLAAHLAHAGFASLRYDPRGKGSSKGDATKATQALMAKDAEAALAGLAAAPNIDKTRIYVLSLGPTSATALALIASKPPKGYVALAPLIKDLKTALIYTDTAVFKAAGFSQKFLDAETAETEKTLTQIQTGTFAGTEWRGLPVALWKEWLAFDGSAALGAFTGPVLALRGDQDLVIGPEQLVAATAAATKTGKTNLTTKTMTGLAFTLTEGSMADLWESALLPLEVPTATIDALTAWLKAN